MVRFDEMDLTKWIGRKGFGRKDVERKLGARKATTRSSNVLAPRSSSTTNHDRPVGNCTELLAQEYIYLRDVQEYIYKYKNIHSRRQGDTNYINL